MPKELDSNSVDRWAGHIVQHLAARGAVLPYSALDAARILLGTPGGSALALEYKRLEGHDLTITALAMAIVQHQTIPTKPSAASKSEGVVKANRVAHLLSDLDSLAKAASEKALEIGLGAVFPVHKRLDDELRAGRIAVKAAIDQIRKVTK
jgi:hypothetical protein